MRYLFILVFALFFGDTVLAQAAPPPAADVIASVIKKATAEKKKVMVIFHASWCGWCHKMDSSLVDPSVKAAFDREFVVEHLTVMESKNKTHLENPGGMDYMKKWGGSEQGLPFWVILNAKGEYLFDSRMEENGKMMNSGCPASEKEVEFFTGLLKKTTKMSPKELEAVAVRFRKNAAH